MKYYNVFYFLRLAQLFRRKMTFLSPRPAKMACQLRIFDKEYEAFRNSCELEFKSPPPFLFSRTAFMLWVFKRATARQAHFGAVP